MAIRIPAKVRLFSLDSLAWNLNCSSLAEDRVYELFSINNKSSLVLSVLVFAFWDFERLICFARVLRNSTPKDTKTK